MSPSCMWHWNFIVGPLFKFTYVKMKGPNNWNKKKKWLLSPPFSNYFHTDYDILWIIHNLLMTLPLDMLQGLPGRLEKSQVVEGAYTGSSTLHCIANPMERVGFLKKTFKLSNTVIFSVLFLSFMWCIFLLSAPSLFYAI